MTKRHVDCGFEMISRDLTSQELVERFSDISDALDHLEGDQRALTNRFTSLRVQQEAHATDSSDSFTKLSTLLATTASLSESFKAFESRSFGSFQKELSVQRAEWLNAANTQTRGFEDEVRKLLGNFRSEVIAVSRESEARHEEQGGHLDYIAEKLASASEVQVVIRDDHVKLSRGLDQLTARFQSFEEAMTKRMDGLESSFTRSIDQALSACEENRLEAQRAHTTTQQLFSLCKEECHRYSEECQSLGANSTEAKLASVEERIEERHNNDISELEDAIAELQESVVRRMDNKFDSVEGKVQRQKEEAIELSTRVSELRHTQDATSSDVSRTIGSLEGEMKSHRARIHDIASSVKDSLNSALEEVQGAVAEVDSKMSFIDQAVSSATSGLQLVTAAREKEEVSMSQFETRLDSSAQKFQENVRGLLATQAAHEAEQLKKMESELERRHRRLVESTHEALEHVTVGSTDSQSQFQTFRQDLLQLHETVAAHAGLLQSHSMEGAVDGAFTEVKDWLRDVERRTISRAEVEEALLTLTSQLTTFRQATQSAEAALSQRLDAEKVARERDTAQQKAHLQRMNALQ